MAKIAFVTAGNKGEMTICNKTTNVCSQTYFVTTSTVLSGNAEWIVEAPFVNGVYGPLADFDTVPFSHMCWASSYTDGVAPVCNPPATPWGILLQATLFHRTQVIATPILLSVDHSSFTDEYEIPDNGM